MGEYSRIAEELLSRINMLGRILAKDIPNIVGGAHQVNCYPGNPGSCHPEAYFISLDGRRHGRGHLKFGVAIEQFVKHMQGTCKGTTQVAVIIADTWNAEAVRAWQPLIEQIKREAHVEAYLVSGSSITQINL